MLTLVNLEITENSKNKKIKNTYNPPPEGKHCLYYVLTTYTCLDTKTLKKSAGHKAQQPRGARAIKNWGDHPEVIARDSTPKNKGHKQEIRS